MSKHVRLFLAGLAALLLMLVPSVAFAHTNTASVATSCNATAGTVVLNVSYTILNDADSGTTTPEWAIDTISRNVKVVQEASGSFCATVTDSGTFVTVKGDSPGASYDIGGTVSAGVTGTLTGGYVETFSGAVLKSSVGGQAFTGDIGTFDYQCTAQGKCNKFDWLANYFNVSGDSAMPAWGWTYHTACNDANGSWTNTLAGNTGDITGAPTTCVTPTPVPPTPTPKPQPSPTPKPPSNIPGLPNTGSDPLA